MATPNVYKYRGCRRAVVQTGVGRKLDLQTQRLKPPYREEQTEHGEKFWKELACL